MQEVDSKIVRTGLEFILSHFGGQHELFPRTIMTGQSKGQIKVDDVSSEEEFKNKILKYYSQSGFRDCRINAFPYNTQYHRIDLDVRNRTAASLIMLDLDLRDFEYNRIKLDKQLRRTLKKMSMKFNESCIPTILWTGNGYHVYQPIDGFVFEKEDVFYKFLPFVNNKDLTSVFLRFAERLFSECTSDPNHMPSIRSCLLRVPGTLNSKNKEQVRIVQKWNGQRPSIKWLTSDFHNYLIQRRIDLIGQRKAIKINCNIEQNKRSFCGSIPWIERLVKTPIADYRKLSIDLILAPYCLLIKKIDESETYDILTEWLAACAQIRELNFDVSFKIRSAIKAVMNKRIPPMKISTLKENRSVIYSYFESLQVV